MYWQTGGRWRATQAGSQAGETQPIPCKGDQPNDNIASDSLHNCSCQQPAVSISFSCSWSWSSRSMGSISWSDAAANREALLMLSRTSLWPRVSRPQGTHLAMTMRLPPHTTHHSWLLHAQCAFELNMQLRNLLKIIFINLVIYAQDQTFN